MRLSKPERKERRRRILKKVGTGVATVAGFGVGAVADAVPGAGAIIKKVPLLQKAPQFAGDADPLQSTLTNEIIPLWRTIKHLKGIIERLFDRLAGFG